MVHRIHLADIQGVSSVYRAIIISSRRSPASCRRFLFCSNGTPQLFLADSMVLSSKNCRNEVCCYGGRDFRIFRYPVPRTTGTAYVFYGSSPNLQVFYVSLPTLAIACPCARHFNGNASGILIMDEIIF